MVKCKDCSNLMVKKDEFYCQWLESFLDREVVFDIDEECDGYG